MGLLAGWLTGKTMRGHGYGHGWDPWMDIINYPVTDVLQTTWPLCDHVYEDTTNPLGPAAVPRRMGSLPLERLAIKAMRKAQMIGASTEPSVTLGSDVASVSFRLYPPAAIAQVGTRARETFLIYGHCENVSRLVIARFDSITLAIAD